MPLPRGLERSPSSQSCTHVAHRARRVAEASATGASLDQQLALPGGIPEESACRSSWWDRGPHARRAPRDGSNFEDSEPLAPHSTAHRPGRCRWSAQVTKRPGPMRVCFSSEIDSEHCRGRDQVPRARASDDSEFPVGGQRRRVSGPVGQRSACELPSATTGDPPRSAIPVITGVAMVQVCNVERGAQPALRKRRSRRLCSGSVIDRVPVPECRRPVTDHRGR